ncbi:MAG: orotate phosphoribosyltransferase [Chitinophagales bacterium]|nr:orotate phosphoribosyltransferase [Chitinophagales bacterium]
MIFSEETARKIADCLLQVKAIKIQPSNPFTWASGWRSPIYCDNRVTLSHPEVRTIIKDSLVALIREKYSNANLIAGVATAGIAQGALVAEALNLPFVYVRPEPKKHGMGRQVEGEVKAGQRAVVIEDLISTGKSSLNALPPLRQEGCEIIGTAATFSYGFEVAEDSFKKSGCLLYTLSDYEALLSVALEKKLIQAHELETLREWRKNPESWGSELGITN